MRKELGRAILLGLEILVAGDIIATVVTEPDMINVLTFRNNSLDPDFLELVY